jgi:hypothetical protein
MKKGSIIDDVHRTELVNLSILDLLKTPFPGAEEVT